MASSRSKAIWDSLSSEQKKEIVAIAVNRQMEASVTTDTPMEEAANDGNARYQEEVREEARMETQAPMEEETEEGRSRRKAKEVPDYPGCPATSSPGARPPPTAGWVSPWPPRVPGPCLALASAALGARPCIWPLVPDPLPGRCPRHPGCPASSWARPSPPPGARALNPWVPSPLAPRPRCPDRPECPALRPWVPGRLPPHHLRVPGPLYPGCPDRSVCLRASWGFLPL
nr:basic proline-rich protein-like [Aegilops tauschii subsp. strangulata]